MRVAVIGAGIVGVTTAYELAVAGHAVTVFERRGSVATGSSFADAGLLWPASATSWALPDLRPDLLRLLTGRGAPVRIGARAALTQAPWLWHWWRCAGAPLHDAGRTALLGLAQASRSRLEHLTQALRLDYEQAPGLLVLLRSERERAQSRAALAVLQDAGVVHEVVDAAAARRIEPALHPETALHAAIRLPQGGVGNCRQFTHLLKAQAQRLGAEFRFEREVRRIVVGPRPLLEIRHTARRTDAAETVAEPGEFDAVVVCAALASAALLRPLGLRLPLLPVWGCSVTAPLRHRDGLPDAGPRAALVDQRHQVAISRLGQRVRVAGGSEFGATAAPANGAMLRTMYRVLEDWFPGAVATREAQAWTGARPTLADELPVIGPSGAPGVWLNLGHGGAGWALACGSALAVSHLVQGSPAPLDLGGLGVERLRGA